MKDQFFAVKFCSLMEAKADDPATGEFSGYAATYQRDSEGDRIQPGAFAQSIKDRKGRIPIFLNHDRTQWAGASTGLAEDGKGLKLNGQLFLDTSAGRDAMGLLKNAASVEMPVGLSIGFLTKDWDYDEASQTRLLKDVDLWETSLTPFPANRGARVDQVKALRNYERLLRDVTNCSASDAKRILSLLPLSLSGEQADGYPFHSARDVRDADLVIDVRSHLRELEGLKTWQ
jgi:HK97 family phage prohead protease